MPNTSTDAQKASAAQKASVAGRLLARPHTSLPPETQSKAGIHHLGLERKRDALLFVPSSYRADRSMPLIVTLHGAGGNAQHGLSFLQEWAEASGIMVLSPDSRDRTWDIIIGRYGPDVAYINRALSHVFEHYQIDSQRLAIAGFSDGASYALSLGVTNGDLFTHIIAFAPGFLAPASQHGTPPIYIAHGTKDRVLPIDRCSRRIVPQVRQAGYRVQYHEFDGPHTVPPEIAREGVQWFLHNSSQTNT
jgi:phospholipase/carboxylesterase